MQKRKHAILICILLPIKNYSLNMNQYQLMLTDSQLYMYYVPVNHHSLNFSLNVPMDLTFS